MLGLRQTDKLLFDKRDEDPREILAEKKSDEWGRRRTQDLSLVWEESKFDWHESRIDIESGCLYR